MRFFGKLTITDDYQIIGPRGKVLKGTKDIKGYIIIKVNSVGVKRSHIIAKSFPEICGEWFEGAEVHHKDRNKINDVPENLQIVSHDEHVLIHMNDHPSHPAWNKGIAWDDKARDKMSESAFRRGRTHSKRVKAIKNNVVTYYDAAIDAAKATGVDFRSVSDCCRGRRKTSKGYQFEFTE